ncbi:glycosyltransferase [Niameybacter massiliensis]|uniref:glycosyltransferase n=1 Tax=Niameybacter massiliensis TaxID=1658108 RepID=UPI0006B519EE|nr:glycosyltransferase [Niameybacter massiliensis]
MTRVLFMLINMNIGGTEKALLNLLEEMPQDKYDITLLMLEKYGGFLNDIPEGVHIQYLRNYGDIKVLLNRPLLQTTMQLVINKRYKESIVMLGLYLWSKITRNQSSFFRYVLRNTPSLDTYYDVAVAFAGPMDFITYFIVKKVQATIKIQWIHFDISKIGFNMNFAKKYYPFFSRIFVVSEEGKEKLITQMPCLADKTTTFYNKIARKRILQQAEETQAFEDDFDGIRILTVGRLSEEKGQDLCIEACKLLRDEGYKFRWYCIGEGNYREICEERIHLYGIEFDFILLGAKQNPYPYMKACDIYVQASRHEGYCITLAEAKVFEKPIITTNFTGAKEQIQNVKHGCVVNCNATAIYKGVKEMLDTRLALGKEVN